MLKKGDPELPADGKIKVVTVKALPSGEKRTKKTPVKTNEEIQREVKDLLERMNDEKGAQIEDVEALSKALGGLWAESMDFATFTRYVSFHQNLIT
jgi:phage host-nuclease inhibitor protein Gam